MGMKNMLRAVSNSLAGILGAERTIILEARLRFGRRMNIKNPESLSDKVCFQEFYKHNPLIISCSDKYDVRAYVASKGSADLLVPLIGDVYSSFDELDYDALPKSFALKACFGSYMNLICEDKSLLSRDKARKTVEGWLKKGFNRDTIEPHYKYMKKRFICERFLENADTIIDYKIHCFNGKPQFIMTCSNRGSGLKLNLYDLEWRPIEGLSDRYPKGEEIARPSGLLKMHEIAERLSADFDFVRVDLYQIGERIYFGELTFTPFGGILSCFTDEFDREMGKELSISR